MYVYNYIHYIILYIYICYIQYSIIRIKPHVKPPTEHNQTLVGLFGDEAIPSTLAEMLTMAVRL